MGDLPTFVLQKVTPGDMQALVVIMTFTGMETKFTAVQHGWKPGDDITSAAIADWAAIAYERNSLEYFHLGIREFLIDFDSCIRNENRQENVLRTTLREPGCARQASENGQDRFLDIPSAACLILCQKNAAAHRWLVGEAIPEEMAALIAQQHPGALQKRACKALIECLIIRKQYGLSAQTKSFEKHLRCLPEVGHVMNRILGV
ncbi:hypothetical protein MY8738_009953 [Beauveria namnaoensis]